MKKARNLGLAVAGVMLLLTSCKKWLDPYIDPIDTTIAFDVAIPAMADTTHLDTLSAAYISFNMDSVIRAKTKEVFSLNNISSVKVTAIEVNLTNPTLENNMANFSTLNLTVAANAGQSPVTVGTLNLPNTYADKAMIPVMNKADVREAAAADYMMITLLGNVRRVTAETLYATVIITFQASSDR